MILIYLFFFVILGFTFFKYVIVNAATMHRQTHNIQFIANQKNLHDEPEYVDVLLAITGNVPITLKEWSLNKVEHGLRNHTNSQH
jgi:hypothetical protein